MYEITNKFYVRLLSGKSLEKKIPKKEYRDFIKFAYRCYRDNIDELYYKDMMNIIYSQIYLTKLNADDFYKVMKYKRNHPINICYNEQTLKEINELFAAYSKYKLKNELETALPCKSDTQTKKVKI